MTSPIPAQNHPPSHPTAHDSTLDSFPRDEFGAFVRRMPNYARLCWVLARDPRLSRVRRAALLAAAAYVVSPIDLVPGFIPVLGQLDDLAIALAAIRLALDGLNPELRAERLGAAGLTQADLEADLRATGAVTVWLARSGLRVGADIATFAFHGAESLRRALLSRRNRGS